MRLPYRKPGKFSQTPQDPLLTEEKFRELERKLDHLKSIRPQAAADVARLAELGDFSENAEYQIAKGRLRGINQRMLELEFQINRAEIIQTTGQADRVGVGQTVTVHDGEKQKSFQILGSAETNPSRGVISHTSPLGAALLGKRLGETVTVPLSKGEVVYTIVRIE